MDTIGLTSKALAKHKEICKLLCYDQNTSTVNNLVDPKDLQVEGMEVIRIADNAPLIYIAVRLFDKNLHAMIDTGATLSAISEKVVEENRW